MTRLADCDVADYVDDHAVGHGGGPSCTTAGCGHPGSGDRAPVDHDVLHGTILVVHGHQVVVLELPEERDRSP